MCATDDAGGDWRAVRIDALTPPGQRPTDHADPVGSLHAGGRMLVYRTARGWRYVLLGEVEYAADAAADTLAGAQAEATREAAASGIMRGVRCPTNPPRSDR